MSRRRRAIDDDGRVICALCGEGVYIWNFYTVQVFKGLTSLDDIWYEKDGILYGAPKSYCRPCNLIAQRGAKAVFTQRTVCANRRLERIDDVIEAEYQAHREVTLRYQDEQIAILNRLSGNVMGLGPPGERPAWED